MAGDKKTSEGAEVASAKSALKLLRVTTDRKIQMPPPHQAWTLVPGANHFEGEPPEPVAKRLLELQTAGIVTVETLDGDGKASPWPAPATDESTKT